ncbi:GNAT family N-acetyltransferase [Balneolaceae bacterium YR4-1]|uniref:GNAT family N-acetyltransferase n=1 Tax=Halalkalibaculum roseum TaxID=2709311 RepID=A0A6M1T6H3_9BACT|nr:GNAT family N-acetyltransferase [Halalkalibaculum roseum]NGP77545.1 GNAT family N-acetyltransferase [Halalkalibaculum roseum]
MDAQFNIAIDEQFISPICDFTYTWCLNCGVQDQQAIKFTIALSELITDIILFAYPTESNAHFEISYRHNLTNVEIIVSEVGEPFDPDRHRYDSNKMREVGDFEGAGFRLIRRFCDEFVFVNKGKEGKEFHLSKEIDVQSIDRMLERSRAEKPKEPTAEEIEKPDLQADNFNYQQVAPSDAEDIAKLIYRTYKYTYSKEELYYPKKIEETLLGKEKLGVIVRDDDGLSLGYFAVLKKSDSNIGEVGEAVVSPGYRKRGIMSNMMKRLIEMARDQKLAGLYGKAVTNHPVSQKVNNKYNFITTALMLADTRNVIFTGFNEDYPQSVSVVIDFLPLFIPEEVTVYMPAKYCDIITDTFKELNIPIRASNSSNYRMAQKSDIDLSINYSDSTSLLVVNKYGPDFVTVLSEMMTSLKKQEDLNAIFLDLPLQNAATPEQFDGMKDLGFIYSGLTPLFHKQSHYLRLQKVYSELDLELIEIYSEFGEKIKTLIADEYH